MLIQCLPFCKYVKLYWSFASSDKLFAIIWPYVDISSIFETFHGISKHFKPFRDIPRHHKPSQTITSQTKFKPNTNLIDSPSIHFGHTLECWPDDSQVTNSIFRENIPIQIYLWLLFKLPCSFFTLSQLHVIFQEIL